VGTALRAFAHPTRQIKLPIQASSSKQQNPMTAKRKRFFLCNWLGPLCSRYRFDDGTIIQSTSRESLGIFRRNKRIDVEFYFDGNGQYEYYLPSGISSEEHAALEQLVNEYCRNKRLRLRQGHAMRS